MLRSAAPHSSSLFLQLLPSRPKARALYPGTWWIKWQPCIVAYRSTFWDMSVMGKRDGWPGACGLFPSMEISAIFTNSRSGIFFHNLGDGVVAGLNVVAAAASMSRPDPDRKEMGRLASVPDKSFSSTILPVSCLNST